MVKRTVRFLKRCGVAIVAFAALLLLGIAAVSLIASRAPLSVGPLSPVAAERIDALFPGLDLDFKDAAIGLNLREGMAELVFHDARIISKVSGDAVSLPRLSITCETMPLFAGELRPHAIVVDGAELHIDWSAATLRAALTGGADTANSGVSFDAPSLIEDILDALSMPRAADNPFSWLRTLNARNLTILIKERASGTEWRADGASLVFRRDGDDLDLRGKGELLNIAGESMAELTLTGAIRSGADRRSLEFGIVRMTPTLFASDIPELQPLAGIAMPIDARLFSEAEIGSNRLLTLGLSAHASTGSVRLAPWYREDRSFRSIDLSLDIAPSARRIDIKRLGLEFADATAFFAGKIVLHDGAPPDVTLSGGIDRLSVDALAAYWPDDLARGAREWIAANITAGILPRADLHLSAKSDDFAGGTLSEGAFHFDFGFEGLEVHALRPMPPIIGAGGIARLDARGLRLDIANGRVDGLPVAGSKVRIGGFDEPGPEYADILMAVRGGIPDILRFIDYQPLGFTTAFGIAPDDVRGEAALEAKLAFPLVKSLGLDDVAIDVGGRLSAVRLLGLVNGGDFTDGALLLRVSRDGLHADGDGRLADIPLDIVWDEDFRAGGGADSSTYMVRAKIDREGLARLVFDPGERMTGMADIALRLTGSGPDVRRGALLASLRDAGLSFAELGWSKPEGVGADLSFEVDFSDPKGIAIEDIAFLGSEDRIDADLSFFGANGAFSSARFRKLQLGATDLAGVVTVGEDAIAARLEGASLDARTFLADLEISQKPDAAPTPTLDLDLKVATLLALGDVRFHQVRAEARHASGLLERLDVSGVLDDETPVALSVTPLTLPVRTLSMSAGNAGRMMRGLGQFKNAEGGSLMLSARLEGEADAFTMSGEADVSNFRLVRSQTLDIVLDSEEASRIDEIAGPDGIRFDRLELPFRLQDGIIDISGALANGPRLGLTLEGQIDQGLERLNVNGVIVPAYGINALLGRIPLLGGLFSGGRGGGMFALAYRVEGSTADPKVSINALTALIPGILRKPFEGAKGKLDPKAPVQEKEPEEETPPP